MALAAGAPPSSSTVTIVAPDQFLPLALTVTGNAGTCSTFGVPSLTVAEATLEKPDSNAAPLSSVVTTYW